MSEETSEETAVVEESQDQAASGSQGKTWYPYITKAQFEKFLSRLQSKMPEQVDRDYIRAIIRTPSMIYRFLRGIEAMKLIDRDQKPTPQLLRLVDVATRQQAYNEILADLYPELLERWNQSNGEMADRDVVAYFRKSSGMGNDSANKMKMFFKYLLDESKVDSAAAAAEAANSAPAETPAPAPAPPQKTESAPQNNNSGGSSNSNSGRRSNSSQSSQQSSSHHERQSSSNGRGALTEAQKAYLETIKSVLNVNVDGDWDDDMIRTAFDRLERLMDRVKRM